MNITRSLEPAIRKDLADRIVMIGGPRQVGKTTLARQFIRSSAQYLNWDDLEDRRILRSHKIDPNLGTVVLDEIHKYRLWRTLLKGIYDKHSSQLSMLVTGSAKLDHFRRGGDSLFGRFHYYRLHPFSLAELDSQFRSSTLQALLQFGGFPEPYLKQDEKFSRRWRLERTAQVVHQDVSDLGSVKEISMIELLIDALPSRVGSPLSIKSLQEDLQVSPNTVSRWIELLESVYYCFRVLPYGPPKIRAVKKANRLYLWDWTEIEEPGARFENLVANHLLKFCHYRQDLEGHRMELRYMRDIDGREIDFVVIQEKKPLFAVECKNGEKQSSPHLKYFKERTKIPKFYQVHLGRSDYLVEPGCRVMPFEKFCQVEKLY